MAKGTVEATWILRRRRFSTRRSKRGKQGVCAAPIFQWKQRGALPDRERLYPVASDGVRPEVKMVSAIQEFDLPARWTSLLQDKYSEAIHNLAKMWPDEGSLEVSFREVEGYDHEFAQDILANPDHHFRAANQALRQFLLDAGEGNLMPFVRIIQQQIRPCANSCWTLVKGT